jgi:peptidoglycan hydrolase-like protein with peptidoglycan-binding domain
MNKTKLAGALILAFLVAPSITLAQTQSVASLQAELQQLLAQVSALETRITTQGSSTTPWCYTFNSNLSIGMSGASVTGLQTALQRDGDSVQVTGTFDDQTASAITSFQEKYSPQILAPYDLSYGTGYVGTTTRAELNSLFGCAAVMNSVPTPTPITSGDINNIPTATLSANPSNITAGQPTTLAWSSTRATTCTINGTDGYNDNGPWSQSNLASSGVESVIPYSSLSKPYTAKYSITCAGSSGTSNPASAAVTVSASTTAQSPTGSVSLVSISSPNGRETLTWGSNNRITWSGGTTKVQVGLVSANFNPSNPSVLGWISLNGSPNSSIFWNAANITDLTGSVNFPVTAGSYKIIVVSQSDDGGYCLNGGCNVSVSAAPFTIVGQSQATGASIQSFAASQVSTDSAIYDVAWVVSGSSAGQVSLTTACALGLTISEGAPGHMQPFKCGDVNDPVAYGEGDWSARSFVPVHC